MGSEDDRGSNRMEPRRMKAKAATDGPRKGGRPRSKETDEAILKATSEILYEQGLDGLTFEAVASRAGVGRPTVYRRWKRKEDLVADAMESRRQHLRIPDTGSLAKDLEAMAEGLGRIVGDPASWSYVALYMATIKRSASARQTWWTSYFEERIDLMRPVFRRAIDRGELSPSVDIDMLMTVVLGAWMCLYLLGTIQGKSPSRKELRKITDFVIGRELAR